MALALAAERPADIVVDPASYRDPAGFVFRRDDRVYRAIRAPAAADYRDMRERGVIERLVAQGLLVPTVEADRTLAPGGDVFAVVEHEALPIITYPYEWGFEALKSAALLHLDLHLAALDLGFTLSDGNAYNVQFVGTRPVFIDLLSLRRYEDGAYWSGHRQFCEQFLNPLLLRSTLGIPHNAWLRGALEGIPAETLSRLLPLRWALRWTVFGNVVLPARLQRRARTRPSVGAARRGARLPLPALRGMLRQMRGFIAKLQPRRAGGVWEDYAVANSYNAEAAALKRAFVARFASTCRPATLLDVGCNTGDFSAIALANGAGFAVGFEGDADTLDRAFRRARSETLAFLPLYQDLANPSSGQGWNGAERRPIGARVKVDAVLALAVLHHLVLARNVPLSSAIDWAIGLAPRGVLEFVPLDDPMAVELLGRRSTEGLDYSEEGFIRHLARRATVVESCILPGSGRRLFAFERLGA